ncbi:MAG: hypothetical protein ACXW3L_11115 [Limisphaerales bacterium]
MILKRILAGAILVTASTSLFAADNSAKDEVTKAAKALAEKPNYSWKTTVVVPEGTQFRSGPTEGKADKDGTTYLTLTFGDNMTEAVIKGDKATYTNQDGDWQSADDTGEGRGRFMGAMIKNFKAPAAQAPEIAAAVKELKKEGDAYSGELTEEGAKTLMSFRGRRAGGEGPEIKDAKGTAKFWVKDGLLSKYEYKVKGSMKFNDNDIDVDRATTTEIKDVGTTKVVVPEAAKKKLT